MKPILITILLAVSTFAGCHIRHDYDNSSQERHPDEKDIVFDKVTDSPLLDGYETTDNYNHLRRLLPVAILDINSDAHIYFHNSEDTVIKLNNDTADGRYVAFSLIHVVTDDRYQVVAWDENDSLTGVGFVLMSSPLYTFLQRYRWKGFEEYRIFEEPDYSSQYMSINEKQYVYARVTDQSGRWLEVEVKYGGKMIYGWIPPEEQCLSNGNPSILKELIPDLAKKSVYF